MDSVVNAIVQEIIEKLVPLAAIFVVGIVLKDVIKPAIAWITSHTDANTLAMIKSIINDVVQEAEANRIKAELAGLAFDAMSWAIKEVDTRLSEIAPDLEIDSDRVISLLRGALLTYLSEHGIDLEIEFPAPEVTPEGDGSTSQRVLIPFESTKRAIDAQARNTLAARLWV